MDDNISPNNEQKEIVQEVSNNKVQKSNTGVIVLLVIIILGLCGYLIYDKVLSSKDVDNTDNHSQEVVEDNIDDSNMEENNLYENTYSSIINQYKTAMNDKDVKEEETYDKYKNLNVGYINDYLFRNTLNLTFYYSYYDIDNNGIKELLIGYGYEDSNNSGQNAIADVYTSKDNSAIKLQEVSNVHYRINLLIFDNGIMIVHGSGSAVSGEEHFYKIGDDGYSEEKIGSYSYKYSSESSVTITDETTNKETDYTSIEELYNAYVKDANKLTDKDFEWKKID